MFESLTDKLNIVLKKLKGHGKLSEQNINDALREVRLALLEADVNFKVAKNFIDQIKKRAVGQEVLDSLTPAQQVIKIVREEMVRLLGEEASLINLSGPTPVPIMLVGLQGSGKTTTIAKLAKFLQNKNRFPCLVSADTYRPAAALQLKKLGESLRVPVYEPLPRQNPVEICRESLRFAGSQGYDTLLIDTAGRWQVDEELMLELKNIKETVKPREILLVADAMTGQEAVNIATKFDEWLALDGVILTKMDGDARGGAALSIKAATQKPIKFVGVGEKPEDLEMFHPDRMASRILGMGDVLSLVEKAQAQFDAKEAIDLEKKIRKDAFTLEDFRDQLRRMRKMGSLEDIIGMIPGMNAKNMKLHLPGEKDLVKIEAIIDSMTPRERKNHTIINGSRRKRIAKGSGTRVEDINRLIKNYASSRKLIKKFGKKGFKGLGGMKSLFQ